MGTRTVILDGLAVRYSDEGTGPILVLLPGWMNKLESFDGLERLLVEKFRIVRLDFPGFGGTEAPPVPWHVVDYVRFVQSFVEKMRLTPYAYVGHSFGGRVILKGFGEGILAADKIVLIASAGNARRNTTRIVAYRIVAKVGKFFARLLPNSWYRQARSALYRSAESDYLDAGPLAKTFLLTIAEDLSADAARIQTPALLVWGAEDSTTPPTDGERLATTMQHATFTLIPRATHAVHREEPQAVAAAMQSFL